MKRSLALIAGLCLTASANEVIESFHSKVVVSADAKLTVTETIRVRAEGEQIKRGIYRDFPTLYHGKFGLRQAVGFEVLSVKRDGRDEPWKAEALANGKRVKFGEASVLLPTGVHTYEFTYRTNKQLGFFADHDELYWNVTGNGWAFDILQAEADIILPHEVKLSTLEGYTGRQGEKGRDFRAELTANHSARFTTTRSLGPEEGLTVVVTWPKGHVADPDTGHEATQLLRDNKGVIVGLAGLLLVLAYYAAVWIAVGKDPAKGTIIPLYDPPKDFSPAAVRYLLRLGSFDNTAFTANIMDLAVRGAISIEENDGTFTLRRKSSDRKKLPADEALLDEKLMASGSSLKLEQSNHARMKSAQSALKKHLALMEEKTFFVRNFRYWFPGLLFSLLPMGISLIDAREPAGAAFMFVWLSIWTIGVTTLLSSVFRLWRSRSWGQALFLSLFSLPFVAGEIAGLFMLHKTTSPWVAAVFLTGIVMNGVFYHLLKAPTLAGRRILDQIEGFKLYLSVAEKDRLRFENPPEQTPELFDRFLPYALALGVEKAWAEKFADVLAAAAQQPGGHGRPWLTGSSFTAATAGAFATSIGSSLSSAVSSASTAPGSSSGSGGGGSSGGGGGGGGGGGW